VPSLDELKEKPEIEEKIEESIEKIAKEQKHNFGIGISTGYALKDPKNLPLSIGVKYRISNEFELRGEFNYLTGKYLTSENWSAYNISFIGKIYLWALYIGAGSSYNTYFSKEGNPTEKIIFDDSKFYFNYLGGIELDIAKNWDVYIEWRKTSSLSTDINLFLVGVHYNF
jgi:opacity protein-like surface antigen